MNENEKSKIEDAIEIEGFDYAMTDYVSYEDHTDEEFIRLHRAFIEARTKLVDFLGVEA